MVIEEFNHCEQIKTITNHKWKVSNKALLCYLSSLNSYKLVGSRIRRCENNGWSGDPQCKRKILFIHFFSHCFQGTTIQKKWILRVCLQSSINVSLLACKPFSDVKTSLSLSLLLAQFVCPMQPKVTLAHQRDFDAKGCRQKSFSHFLIEPLAWTCPCLADTSFHTADCLLFHLNSGHFSHLSAVTCDAVLVLANGRSSWDSDSDSPTAGQTINFACDEGHVLAGASSIVCQENGTYDRQPPTCLSKHNLPLCWSQLVHVARSWSAPFWWSHSSTVHVCLCFGCSERPVAQEVGCCCTSTLVVLSAC